MSDQADVAGFKRALSAARMMEPTQNIIEKCVLMCEKYSTSADDIVLHIEAFLGNNSLEVLTLENFGKFEQELHRESTKNLVGAKRKSPAKAPVTSKPPLPKRLTDMPSPMMMAVKRESSFSTPNGSAGNNSERITYRDTPSPENSQGSQGSRDSSPMTLPGSEEVTGTTEDYRCRKDTGKVIVRSNPALGIRGEFEPSDRNPLGLRCAVETNENDFENKSERYRFMFTTLEERARAFEKHMMTMQEAMCELASIDPENLTSVGVPSQDAVWVCGRVCCDSEGKINNTSVLLEGSKRESAGRRVRLDLQDMKAAAASYSLFPGQIILVYGTNSSGQKMLAQRIIEGVPAPLPTSSPERLLELHHSSNYQGGKALSVVVAAGPFTTSLNLEYEPLRDLLMEALTSQPDVLILTGPFVDITQPLLKTGEIYLNAEDDEGRVTGSHSASYEMVFIEKVIRDCFSALYNSNPDLPTHIILVPSLLDAHHEFVYPQPAFGDRDEVQSEMFVEAFGVLKVPNSKNGDVRKRVHLLPNPCMFRINEVLFGVTSNDTLFALNLDSVSENQPAGNKLSRLPGHVLQQQSFCPQYPMPATSDCQLDMRQARHWQMKSSPDVLIFPSKMTALVKDIGGTLVINPGQLVKESYGGTYATLTIHPLNEAELRDAKIAGKEDLPHSVCSRSSVTIQKI